MLVLDFSAVSPHFPFLGSFESVLPLWLFSQFLFILLSVHSAVPPYISVRLISFFSRSALPSQFLAKTNMFPSSLSIRLYVDRLVKLMTSSREPSMNLKK